MKDRGKAKILAAIAAGNTEIISESADFVSYYDNDLDCSLTAMLRDPSVEWLSSIIHIMPGAEESAPPKELIIDYMMSLDPAMIAGLSGVYVRAGKDDDRKILDASGSGDVNVLRWHEYRREPSGWLWEAENAVVVNMEAISEQAAKAAADVWPEERLSERRRNEKSKTEFEQFFITLGHEIRHAAIYFPLTDVYCEIYPNPERSPIISIEDVYDEDGFPDNALSEKDAEEWGVKAFENWQNPPNRREIERLDAAGAKQLKFHNGALK